MKESKNLSEDLSLPEPLRFIKAIHEKEIRYLLIGRQAVIAYGGPVQTMDYDIYIDGSEENTNKLLDIASSFGLYPSMPKQELKNTFKFKLENDCVIDVFRAKYLITSKTKKISFEEIYDKRVKAKDISGLEINLPNIDDLILLKKIRSSSKDLLDIKYLEAIKKK